MSLAIECDATLVPPSPPRRRAVGGDERLREEQTDRDERLREEQTDRDERLREEQTDSDERLREEQTGQRMKSASSARSASPQAAIESETP